MAEVFDNGSSSSSTATMLWMTLATDDAAAFVIVKPGLWSSGAPVDLFDLRHVAADSTTPAIVAESETAAMAT